MTKKFTGTHWGTYIHEIKNKKTLFNYWKKRGHDLKFITFDKNADTVNLVKKKNCINIENFKEWISAQA